MRTWLHAVEDHARAHRISERIVDALRVYDRGGDRAWSADLEALEAALSTEVHALAKRIRTELAAHIDAHQARMFAERDRKSVV